MLECTYLFVRQASTFYDDILGNTPAKKDLGGFPRLILCSFLHGEVQLVDSVGFRGHIEFVLDFLFGAKGSNICVFKQ